MPCLYIHSSLDLVSRLKLGGGGVTKGQKKLSLNTLQKVYKYVTTRTDRQVRKSLPTFVFKE